MEVHPTGAAAGQHAGEGAEQQRRPPPRIDRRAHRWKRRGGVAKTTAQSSSVTRKHGHRCGKPSQRTTVSNMLRAAYNHTVHAFPGIINQAANHRAKECIGHTPRA